MRCGGKSTGTASASISGGVAPYSYLWSNGLGTNASVSNLSAGTYTVTVTDAAGCSKTKSVTITQNPGLILIVNQTGANSATANVSGGVSGYTYYWNTIPAQTSLTATGLITGSTYKLKVTDSKGCTQIGSIMITGAKVISDGTLNNLTDLAVYPNPSHQLLHISFSNNDIEEIKIGLIDISGRIIKKEIYKSNSRFNEFTFDIESLTPGVYLLQIENNNALKVVRIIKD